MDVDSDDDDEIIAERGTKSIYSVADVAYYETLNSSHRNPSKRAQQGTQQGRNTDEDRIKQTNGAVGVKE